MQRYTVRDIETERKREGDHSKHYRTQTGLINTFVYKKKEGTYQSTG